MHIILNQTNGKHKGVVVDLSGILGTIVGKTLRVSFGLLLGGAVLWWLSFREGYEALKSFYAVIVIITVFSGGLWVSGVISDAIGFVKQKMTQVFERKQEKHIKKQTEEQARAILTEFEKLPAPSRYIVAISLEEDTELTYLKLTNVGMQELMDIRWIHSQYGHGYRFKSHIWDGLEAHRKEIRSFLDELAKQHKENRINWLVRLNADRDQHKRRPGLYD